MSGSGKSVLMITAGINAIVPVQRPSFSPEAPRLSGLVQKDGSTNSSSAALTTAERVKSPHREVEPPEDNCAIIARKIRELVATTPRLPGSQVVRQLSGNHASSASASPPSPSPPPIPPESQLCVRSITIAGQDQVQNGGFENLADIMNDTTNRIAMFPAIQGCLPSKRRT